MLRDGTGPIYLLDLIATLVAPGTELVRPYERRIDIETYRQWIADAMKTRRCILITARSERYREPTLDSIERKTGWRPELSYWNRYGEAPQHMKPRVLRELIMPDFGTDPTIYFGLESNVVTRTAYAAIDVRSCRIGDLPCDVDQLFRTCKPGGGNIAPGAEPKKADDVQGSLF